MGSMTYETVNRLDCSGDGKQVDARQGNNDVKVVN